MIALLLLTIPSQAACPSSVPIDGALECGSVVHGTFDGTGTSELGGTCDGCTYSCGSTWTGLAETQVEHVYEAACPGSGKLAIELVDASCDLDLYLLGDACDPGATCLDGDTNPNAELRVVQVACEPGDIFYAVVEAYGYGSTGSGRCAGPETYTLWIDAAATNGCDCDADGDAFEHPSCGGTDCDDADATISPLGVEVCDGIDQDCDGVADDGVDQDWWLDEDADGYGTGQPRRGCAEDGWAAAGGDCDDADPTRSPGVTETENGIDDDCDGLVDEGFGDTGVADTDPADTDPPAVDTDDEDTDTEDTDGSEELGAGPCGCGPGAPIGWAPLIGLLAIIRRRAR